MYHVQGNLSERDASNPTSGHLLLVARTTGVKRCRRIAELPESYGKVNRSIRPAGERSSFD